MPAKISLFQKILNRVIKQDVKCFDDIYSYQKIIDEIESNNPKHNSLIKPLIRFIQYNPPESIVELCENYINASYALRVGHSMDSYIIRYGNVDAAKIEYDKRNGVVSERLNVYYEDLSKDDLKLRHAGYIEHYYAKYGETEEAENRYKSYLEKRSETSKTSIQKTLQILKDEPHRRATTLQYWIDKSDGDVELAKKLLKERQATGSLKQYQKRHGIKEGYRLWRKRNRKWQQTMKSKSVEEISRINSLKYRKSDSPNAKNVSKSANEFFEKLASCIDDDLVYGSKGVEFEIQYTETNRYYYDCYIPKYNLIIEYHGIWIHPKPLQRDWVNILTGSSYNENRLKDLRKKFVARQLGYNFIEVWSDEDQTLAIEKIIKFIGDIKSGNLKAAIPRTNLP